MANRPGFFKFYIPSLGEENQKIPLRFVQSVQATWPMNLALRDRYNNLWNVKVEMVGGNWYFREGWTKFVDDNKIKGGEMLVYEYFSQGLLDFKVHGRNACLTEGVGGRKTENSEERITKRESDDDVIEENRQDAHIKEEQATDDDSDDDRSVPATEEKENLSVPATEAEEMKDEENRQDAHIKEEQATGDDSVNNRSVPATEQKENRTVPATHIKEEQATDDDSVNDRSVPATEQEENRSVPATEAEETTEDDTNDVDYVPTTKETNQRDACRVEKEETSVSQSVQATPQEVPRDDNSQREPVRDGMPGSTRRGTRRDFDWFGDEIFKAGLLPLPQNPYFVTKIRADRPGQLYLPMEVLKAYRPNLPERVTLFDPHGRQYLAKLKIWRDGRTFYLGGWKGLCKANLVGVEDACICEFVGDGDDMSIRVSFYPPR